MAYMYFVGDEHDRVKIGVSAGSNRFSILQAGNADQLTEIGYLECGGCAFSFESELHRSLYDFRVERLRSAKKPEWFNQGHAVVSGVIKYLESVLRDGKAPKTVSECVMDFIPATVAGQLVQSIESWNTLTTRFSDMKEMWDGYCYEHGNLERHTRF